LSNFQIAYYLPLGGGFDFILFIGQEHFT